MFNAVSYHTLNYSYHNKRYLSSNDECTKRATFAPTVQSGEHAEQVEHVSDADTYTEDAHTYALEPEGHTESGV